MELHSAAILAKDSATHDSQPVASSTGLGFRSISPSSSQTVPQAAISVFLTEDDIIPPSNQLEAEQLVAHDTTSLGHPGGIQLQEITLPLSALQMKTAYSLLRTLRAFCCENPDVLDTTAVLVLRRIPPVGDARSPYQVPPPASAWPILQLLLNALSLHGDLSGEQQGDYVEDVYVYHQLLLRWRIQLARTLVAPETQFRI